MALKHYVYLKVKIFDEKSGRELVKTYYAIQHSESRFEVINREGDETEPRHFILTTPADILSKKDLEFDKHYGWLVLKK